MCTQPPSPISLIKIKWPSAITLGWQFVLHVLWRLIQWFAGIRERNMVKHDTECPYWDQMSFNNTNMTNIHCIGFQLLSCCGFISVPVLHFASWSTKVSITAQKFASAMYLGTARVVKPEVSRSHLSRILYQEGLLAGALYHLFDPISALYIACYFCPCPPWYWSWKVSPELGCMCDTRWEVQSNWLLRLHYIQTGFYAFLPRIWGVLFWEGYRICCTLFKWIVPYFLEYSKYSPGLELNLCQLAHPNWKV